MGWVDGMDGVDVAVVEEAEGTRKRQTKSDSTLLRGLIKKLINP